jgi:hypothetical protein
MSIAIDVTADEVRRVLDYNPETGVSTPKSNTTGWKGVMRSTVNPSRFIARIRVGSKRLHLGTFKSVEEAAEAYMFAALEHHGDFARLS